VKIEYWTLDDGEPGVLADTITVAADGTVSYETEAAKELYEGRQRLFGDQAAETLSDWSNGYVQTKAVDESAGKQPA
jgi:hypothetical protein